MCINFYFEFVLLWIQSLLFKTAIIVYNKENYDFKIKKEKKNMLNFLISYNFTLSNRHLNVNTRNKQYFFVKRDKKHPVERLS